MARFTTRVELRKTPRDYNALHDEMEGRGFTRTIKNSKGKEYHLPPAEYNYEGEKTEKEVLALAVEAASAVDNDFEILVTKSDGRTWHELKDA